MILIFAKYPIPGKVKTRLIPTLGAQRAARLHRRMTEAALDTAEASGLPAVLCATGAPLRHFRAWLGNGPVFVRQGDGDLGRRMERAFARAFRQGTDKTLAIGADVPGLTPKLLRDAAAALDSADVVLGPASDGGYYLMGMRRLHLPLFQGVAWGSDTVLSQTRQLIVATGLKYRELPVLPDVDRPADLLSVRNDARLADALDEWPRLSIVIPTLNEEVSIGKTLEAAQTARNIEIIVADGGSTDGTREIAVSAGAVVLDVPGGRAAQLNAGAMAASAGRLLFLHADTWLPEKYASALHTALDDPSVAVGAFRFKTDWSTPGMRLVEGGTWLRSGILRWPYGDQGLFLDRRVFTDVGGFPALQIMEDFELVRHLRRRGRVVTLPDAVTTSARRWRQNGILRVWLMNRAMLLAYRLGMSDTRLSRFYRRRAG